MAGKTAKGHGHLLGMHWMRIHQDNERDFAHVRAMGYRSITLFKPEWEDKDFCDALLQNVDKDTIFLLRDHAKSEEKEQAKDNPAGVAALHAVDWNEKYKNGKVHIPSDRAYLLGINEWNTNVWPGQCGVYHHHFADNLGAFGLRPAGLSFGVGHPSTYGLQKEADPDWSWYGDAVRAISRAKGLVNIHEYWMPDEWLWGKWAGRFLEFCPYDVKVVVDECLIDSGVVGLYPSLGYRHYFNFAQNPDAATPVVLGQLDFYQSMMASDERFLAICPFTYDSNDDWWTFDILPIAKAMEEYAWSAPKSGEQYKLHLPAVIKEPGPPTVPAPPTSEKPPPPHSFGAPLGWAFAPGTNAPITQIFGQNPEDYAKFGIPGHNGIDYAAPLGTPVLAIADGTVEWVGEDENYGTYVRVFHRHLGLHSFYAHLSATDVEQGDEVKQRDKIGKVGSTGNSTGPHLHLELRLAEPDGTYHSGTYGYGKGRFDPIVAYHLLNYKENHE